VESGFVWGACPGFGGTAGGGLVGVVMRAVPWGSFWTAAAISLG